jgi:hypothetical protein
LDRNEARIKGIKIYKNLVERPLVERFGECEDNIKKDVFELTSVDGSSE